MGTLQSLTQNAGGPAYPQFLTAQQSFSYDGLNRLVSASDSGGRSRSFGYDQFGDVWVTSNSGAPLAGNTPTSNVYGGNNWISGGSAVNAYDAFRPLAAEYDTAVSAPSPCGTCYLSTDHLGSTRLVTDGNANVIARHDFLPFGQELSGGVAGRNAQWDPDNDTVDPRFTGQILDQESGLDYFNARYLDGPLGRLLSPDSVNAGADPYNPQTWNGYAYLARNSRNDGIRKCKGVRDSGPGGTRQVSSDSLPLDRDPCWPHDC